MFTWICPKCGREVPPSHTECPDCKAAERRAQEARHRRPRPPLPHRRPGVSCSAAELRGAAWNTPPPAVPRVARDAARRPSNLAPDATLHLRVCGLRGGHLLAGWLYARSEAYYHRGESRREARRQNPPAAKYIEVSGVRFIENAKRGRGKISRDQSFAWPIIDG